MDNLLVTFLLLMVSLFFIPKLLQGLRIPSPITEFSLGVLLILIFPGLVTAEMTNIVTVFGAIGVITIFLFAGMEIDFGFLKQHKSQLVLSTAAHVFLIALLAFVIIWHGEKMGVSSALLIGLVLVTPSAGFILSMLDSSRLPRGHKAHHSARAISAEIVAILLLIIFLQLEKPNNLILTILALLGVVIGLPWLLDVLYSKLLRKVINIEFPLFFVVALITAFITELLGLHFIVGAFVAGVVIHIFIQYIVEDKIITSRNADNLIQGMNFLAKIFVPFYFFSVGLQFKSAYLSPGIIVFALGLAIVVSIVRLLVVGGFLALKSRSLKNEVKTATALLPTLMVGFIVADILHSTGRISGSFFAVLIWYAIFTSLTPLLTNKTLQNVVIPRKRSVKNVE